MKRKAQMESLAKQNAPPEKIIISENQEKSSFHVCKFRKDVIKTDNFT